MDCNQLAFEKLLFFFEFDWLGLELNRPIQIERAVEIFAEEVALKQPQS